MSIDFDKYRGQEDYDPGPVICPGCYAIGAEPHAAWCPDWSIEQEHEEAMRLGEYDDWEDDDEPNQEDTD